MDEITTSDAPGGEEEESLPQPVVPYRGFVGGIGLPSDGGSAAAELNFATEASRQTANGHIPNQGPGGGVKNVKEGGGARSE